MYDTIIIGAGLSGLAAGIRLAHYDKRVCILERHTTIGGLNSFYRQRGRDFDVGLHAVTNYAPQGSRRGPLARLLRQLRFRWEDFALVPQAGSSVAFPGVTLRFNNDFRLFEAEVAAQFPDQKDNLRKLVAQLIDYDDLDGSLFQRSTRALLAESITDPLLREMILCPVMWYGNARERDMDFGQFCIMFRSIFLEGFARPLAGVRLILRNLVRRFRSLGGELRLRSGVRRIQIEDGRAVGVELDNGEQLEARHVLSSAGIVETMRMSGERKELSPEPGQMSFIESIAVLDRLPRELGHHQTIVFFNDSETFHWERPQDEICDARSGVICSPNNFLYDGDVLPDGILRVTLMADYDRWCQLSADEYRLAKLHWFERTLASAARFVPDCRQHVIDMDMFTPRTIQRYTWHDNGAVYGAPEKRLDGRTKFANLFICGTDQGYVGIVGSLLSGILVANRHLLGDS
ncbi:MAG: NAD(P)/FAD-dependent oxidoreductase [Planctomycetaceae bacterium]|nr:NAD(P)/FAD-dependent oxidoreductase [Planctomycetaceae bacterium]